MKVRGQNEFQKWEDGSRLTLKQAILAHCYECNGFEDSNNDCLGAKSCVLYPFSPSGRRAKDRASGKFICGKNAKINTLG